MASEDDRVTNDQVVLYQGFLGPLGCEPAESFWEFLWCPWHTSRHPAERDARHELENEYYWLRSDWDDQLGDRFTRRLHKVLGKGGQGLGAFVVEGMASKTQVGDRDHVWQTLGEVDVKHIGYHQLDCIDRTQLAQDFPEAKLVQMLASEGEEVALTGEAKLPTRTPRDRMAELRARATTATPGRARKLPADVQAALDAHNEMLRQREPALPSSDIEEWMGNAWENADRFGLTSKPRTPWEVVEAFCDTLSEDRGDPGLCELAFADAQEAFRQGLAVGAELARHKQETGTDLSPQPEDASHGHDEGNHELARISKPTTTEGDENEHEVQ
jgi:hypothetical protein